MIYRQAALEGQVPIPSKREIADFASYLNIDSIHFGRVEKLEEERDRFNKWISYGHNAGMKWLERNIDKRFDPSLHLNGAFTVISIAVSYFTGKSTGKVSRYVSGKDYHTVLKEKLWAIDSFIRKREPKLESKACVDSSVLAEKSIGALSGIGWTGKNSLLVNQRLGSWFFLGELIINIEYEPDDSVSDGCGKCTRCIDACPTKAINNDRTIDAGKCISYMTVEDKDCLPASRHGFIFGCDICQEACPWNLDPVKTREPAFIETNGLVKLKHGQLENLDPETYSQLCRGTAFERVSYRKFIDNIKAITSSL